jgi:hypothetical protein
MSEVDDRRKALQGILSPYTDTVSRVRQAYFEQRSMALADKHEVEFQIKGSVSDHYRVPFRSVVFTGSAQLGFSPHKDTAFSVGASDLDVAVIDNRLYQDVWAIVLRVTNAFNDLSSFHSSEHADQIKNHMLRRGMILLDFMPKCLERSREQAYLDQLSQRYRRIFGRISLAIYMNETAFCIKQASALSNILGFRNAE